RARRPARRTDPPLRRRPRQGPHPPAPPPRHQPRVAPAPRRCHGISPPDPAPAPVPARKTPVTHAPFRDFVPLAPTPDTSSRHQPRLGADLSMVMKDLVLIVALAQLSGWLRAAVPAGLWRLGHTTPVRRGQGHTTPGPPAAGSDQWCR